jgi:hypothetical protein
MRASGAAFIILALSLATGCARVEKVVAVESGSEIPYISLGTLEVKERISSFEPSQMVWGGVEVLSLSFANTPKRWEQYKKLMRRRLAELAKERYGAHAVINVVYWPDPSNSKFPEGYLYARGEMIRYQRFPQPAAAA